MIQLYGNGDRNSARRYRAPQEKQRSALLHVTTERGDREEEANLNLLKTHIYTQGESAPADVVRLKSTQQSSHRESVPIFTGKNGKVQIQAPQEVGRAPGLREETREYRPAISCTPGNCPRKRHRRLLKELQRKRRLPVGEKKTIQEKRRELKEKLSQLNFKLLNNSDLIREEKTDFKIMNRNFLTSIPEGPDFNQNMLEEETTIDKGNV